MSQPSLLDRLRALDPERYAHRLAPAGAILCLLAAVIGHWAAIPLAVLGLALLLVSCVSRTDGLLVLGPFVRAELVRATRRRFPPAFWRALYAAGVLAVLGLTYQSEVESYWYRYHPSQPGQIMQRVAVTFFGWFVACQFVYLAFLTVALLAPVVAEEREAKRLDFLLVTDLRNREILVGKAVGRLPQLLDPVLASLPVLALLPFFGGVPPGFVIAAAIATVATVLSLAGVSFYASVVAPNRENAIAAPLGVTWLFLAFTGVPWITAIWQDSWTFPASIGINSPVQVSGVVKAVSCGNPVAVAAQLTHDLNRRGADPEPTVLRAVRWYSVFHLGVFLLFGLKAIAELRQHAESIPLSPVKPSPEPPQKAEGTDQPPTAPDQPTTDSAEELRPPKPPKPRRKWISFNPPPRPFPRPPVSDEPVTWWEMFRDVPSVHGGNWRKELKANAIAGVVIVLLLHLLMLHPRVPWSAVRGFVSFAAWGACLGATLSLIARASMAISREREKDTLEALMLTGLGCREILRQKWRGCLLFHRSLVGLLGGILLAGLLTYSIHPLSALGLLVLLPVHVAFAASLGLFFSVRAKTTNKVNLLMWPSLGVWMLLVGVVAGLAAELVFPYREQEPFAFTVAVPPAASGALMFVPLEWGRMRNPPIVQFYLGAFLGTVIYAGLAWLLWRGAVQRFERDWERRVGPATRAEQAEEDQEGRR